MSPIVCRGTGRSITTSRSLYERGACKMVAMIRFEGVLTPELYRRAMSVRLRSVRNVTGFWIFAAVVMLFSAKGGWGTPLFLVFVGAFLMTAPRRAATRAFAADPLLSERMTGEADERGVRIEQAHGSTDLPWSSTYDVAMTSKVVIVYQSASLFRVFPREFFADEESWQTFRRLAAVAVPPVRPQRGRLLLPLGLTG